VIICKDGVKFFMKLSFFLPELVSLVGKGTNAIDWVFCGQCLHIMGIIGNCISFEIQKRNAPFFFNDSRRCIIL